MIEACFTFTHQRWLDLLAVMLAAIALLAVNVAAGSLLKPLYIDLTEERLFSLSENTKDVIVTIDEPITVRVYFSKKLGERSPLHATFYTRIKGLLLQYVDLAGGMVKVEFIDPEPFSEAEDRAVAFGLQGVPMSEGGELGYFGLAATNSVDAQETVSFFNLERETFIEYDLTRLFHSLAMTKRKTIGILSTLPLNSRSGLGGVLMDQIHALFKVHLLPTELDALPPDIDVLMVVQPTNLPVETLYIIDQFVLRGGRVLLFIDPVAENGLHNRSILLDLESISSFTRILKSWGVSFTPDQVAANIDAARRVNAGQGMHSMITDHVAWLSLGQEAFDDGDAVVGTLERVNVATAGILEAIDGATTAIYPLISTSSRSMRLSAEKFKSPLPDIESLVLSFQSENQRLTLAIRVTGVASSAFVDGSPILQVISDKNHGSHLEISKTNINVILVADTDVLADRFWVQKQDFFGQQLSIPVADNGIFVLNALENLSGAEALIGLRGRGRIGRPFVLLETLRREAEWRYRARERALLQQIDAVQGRLHVLERRENKQSDLLLLPQERKNLENFRRDLLVARRELRAVKHALAQDIEHREAWTKAINIAGVPLVLAGVAGGVAMRRRRRDTQEPVER
ncbi:gliding motility protein GldG [invertebrate metagenome]|uniref:Gliding motility protein GldG n=1 Tax=invertebrate metagenome TaxID=1711999 RepID=A0A484H575_9ZZZZ